MTPEEPVCSCRISGQMLDPKDYMKVISHDLRKMILHKLFALTIDLPISKKQIAEILDVKYEKVNYQLNEHLRDFWSVKHRQKIRGTYKEFISPEISNSIYINIGSDHTLYIMDPLANIFGTVRKVGTRCDQCTKTNRNKCLSEMKEQQCLDISPQEKRRWEDVLEYNGRKRPFSPVDYMVVCTVSKSLDKENCAIQLTNCGCPFLEKIRQELAELQGTD